MKKLIVCSLFVAVASFAAPAPSTTIGASERAIQGVDPATYLQKRSLKPEALTELRKLPAAVALAVLDDPRAFLSAKPRDADAEVRALKLGALTALVEKEHPTAAARCLAAMKDSDLVVAANGAERLGQTQTAQAVDVLGALLVDAKAELGVRAGAAAGLGRHRSPEALHALIAGTTTEQPEQVRIAALRGMATLGSRWAWEARGDTKTGDKLRAEAADVVVGVVGGADVEAVKAEVLRVLR